MYLRSESKHHEQLPSKFGIQNEINKNVKNVLRIEHQVKKEYRHTIQEIERQKVENDRQIKHQKRHTQRNNCHRVKNVFF